MKIFRAIFLIFDICLILFISFIFYLKVPVKTPQNLEIPKGSIGSIISNLNKQNINLSSFDKYILAFLGSPQSGFITLSDTKFSKLDFLYELTISKARMQEITLIPGETTEIFLDIIAKNLELNSTKLKEEFVKISPFEDGFFIAETYKIPYKIDEARLISHLAKISKQNFDKIFKENYTKDLNNTKIKEILIVASIIQKEAANIDEMPLVSSVIYNRLQKNMALQMDGTLNYGKFSHIKVTPERIKNDNSGFNTYKFAGLPPSPVCNVSIDAIKAAINPAKTEFLYFMRQKQNNSHKFTKTYDEHLQVINEQRKLK